MRQWRHYLVVTVTAVGFCRVASSVDFDVSGYASLEPRIFFDAPLFPVQPAAGPSASTVLAPEFRFEWNDGVDRFTLSPYLRWDADDTQRTHADLREAFWQHADGSWTWRVGLARVFWGVTESRHLVDTVNQTDLVEDIDGEDKLGQAMIMLERWTASAGTFSLFILPGFRERTFPAADARLRGILPVDAKHPVYTSSAGNKHIDWAIRWSNTFGNWDIGASVFRGTSREPRLLPIADPLGGARLTPYYDVVNQLGVDLQYTRGAWLWKMESIGRSGQGKPFFASVSGFEYTFYGVAETRSDLGLLFEYLYDGRDTNAPPTPYDNDIFLGARWALNDAQDTSLLGGAIFDANGTQGFLEARRRLGETWVLETEFRWFPSAGIDNLLLYGYVNDSFTMVRLAKHW